MLFPKWDIALALNRHRRLVGVSSFAYALLHFCVQVLYVYDGGFVTLGKEIQKPFQLTGLAALVILLNINTAAIVHTALLAAIGAGVSYAVSLMLKWVARISSMTR